MRLFPTILIGVALAGPALANDSSAELTTGGLVLTKNDNIELRSEDLSISEREIVVRYKFFNHGQNDDAITVAFPLPDIVWDGPDANISIPDPDAENFLDFKTRVEGAPVDMRLERKAFAHDKEITDKLTALGVPLGPQSAATGKKLDALPKATQDDLVDQGIAIPDDYDAGKGWEHHFAPNWTLKTTYYWRQTFPAGRELSVEHRYRPSVGETAGTELQSEALAPDRLKAYEQRYCVDRAFLNGLSAASGKRDANGAWQHYLFESRIAYVLTTGANWAGPIGDFHLIIDKTSPDRLISFCEDGVKKISPTQFEVRHMNFTPRRDLDILILAQPRR